MSDKFSKLVDRLREQYRKLQHRQAEQRGRISDSDRLKFIEADGRVLAGVAIHNRQPITILQRSNSVMIYCIADPDKIQEIVSAIGAVANSWQQKATGVGQ